jgi:PPOX class probable F420-dependent enzyme
MTAAAVDELLGSAEMGVLCTADAEGRPQGTPIWFDYDGSCVRILVHRDSKKARNIRANPHVSLTVDTRVAPYRGVVLRATASLSGPDPALRRVLASRYLGEQVAGGYIESTLNLDHDDVLVTLTITGRYSWDYSSKGAT